MNEALEALNGSWAILAGYAVFFTALHLYVVVKYGDKPFWDHVMDLGFQLAVAAAIICAGIFLSRAAIWYWRFMTEGDLSQLSNQGVPLGIGAVVGSIGFVLYIRIITKPFGFAPVFAAVATVMFYLATFIDV